MGTEYLSGPAVDKLVELSLLEHVGRYKRRSNVTGKVSDVKAYTRKGSVSLAKPGDVFKTGGGSSFQVVEPAKTDPYKKNTVSIKVQRVNPDGSKYFGSDKSGPQSLSFPADEDLEFTKGGPGANSKAPTPSGATATGRNNKSPVRNALDTIAPPGNNNGPPENPPPPRSPGKALKDFFGDPPLHDDKPAKPHEDAKKAIDALVEKHDPSAAERLSKAGQTADEYKHEQAKGLAERLFGKKPDDKPKADDPTKRQPGEYVPREMKLGPRKSDKTGKKPDYIPDHLEPMGSAPNSIQKGLSGGASERPPDAPAMTKDGKDLPGVADNKTADALAKMGVDPAEIPENLFVFEAGDDIESGQAIHVEGKDGREYTIAPADKTVNKSSLLQERNGYQITVSKHQDGDPTFQPIHSSSEDPNKALAKLSRHVAVQEAGSGVGKALSKLFGGGKGKDKKPVGTGGYGKPGSMSNPLPAEKYKPPLRRDRSKTRPWS